MPSGDRTRKQTQQAKNMDRRRRTRSVTASAKTRTGSLVLTVGHSTRSLEEFVQLLQLHQVSCVADIRTIPRSRHNPQFNLESLPGALKQAGIEYVHVPALGGLRHTNRKSPNLGWRNASFRGYADYMQTPEFERAIDDLIALARRKRLALMCAEAVPWRCHRSLVADVLMVHGVSAEHIMSATSRKVHTLTPFARVQGRRITYPPGSHLEQPQASAGKAYASRRPASLKDPTLLRSTIRR